MNTLAAFTFSPEGGESITLRAVQIDGSPWFVARDICSVLWDRGYPSDHTKWLDEDQKIAVTRTDTRISDPSVRRAVFDTKTGFVSLVSESGLYRLILRAESPHARAFQDWVTREVLPAIRKDGAYVMGEEKVRTGEMSEDELVLKALEAMQRKVARLSEERDAARQQVEALEPKAAIVDAAFGERRPTLNAFARTLDGVNLIQLPAWLAGMGFLYRHVGPKSGVAVYRVRADRLPAEKPEHQAHHPGREGYPAEPGHGHHARIDL